MEIRLGFLGTGRITSALVEGFCTVRDFHPNVLVTPRNAERASRLAKKFSQVEVGKSTQAVGILGNEACIALFGVPSIWPLPARQNTSLSQRGKVNFPCGKSRSTEIEGGSDELKHIVF